MAIEANAGGSAAATAGLRFHAHRDEAALVAVAGASILDAVNGDLAAQAEAWILLSGGTTPVPVYRAIAQSLGDTQGLTVGLVDDRWVAPDSPGNNAAMIRETLLPSAGNGVRFRPLVDWSRGRAHSVAQANARHASMRIAPSLVLFGMGDDGHTASLFPGSPQLAKALASHDAYVPLDADGCPGAGQWPQRITLTPHGWRRARRRMLLVRGERKREMLERAARERDARLLPVSAAIAVGDTPLDVHWCP
jgi:6-phosphogluconolactonase